MKKDRYIPLPFPVLIATDERDAEGEGNFKDSKGFTRVRRIRTSDLDGLSASRLEAVSALRDSLKRLKGLPEALDAVKPWIPSFPAGVTEIAGADGTEWTAARWDYANLVTLGLLSAQLVMWCPYTESGLGLLPGIYCQDRTAAKFVSFYLGYARACTKCRRLFVPKNFSDTQKYCTPAHGSAHRKQRSLGKQRTM